MLLVRIRSSSMFSWRNKKSVYLILPIWNYVHIFQQQDNRSSDPSPAPQSTAQQAKYGKKDVRSSILSSVVNHLLTLPTTYLLDRFSKTRQTILT